MGRHEHTVRGHEVELLLEGARAPHDGVRKVVRLDDVNEQLFVHEVPPLLLASQHEQDLLGRLGGHLGVHLLVQVLSELKPRFGVRHLGLT